MTFLYHLIDFIIEREKLGPRCKGPPTHGKCIPKPYHGFTFDPVSKTCKKVMLGGCGRTNNGFLTQEECEAKCSKFNLSESIVDNKV